MRIVEAGGIGPGPFAAMMLADMGADVVRIDTPRTVAAGQQSPLSIDPLYRSRRSVAIDLKHSDGVETLLGLVRRADGLIEGFRPGVAERLGFGPELCAELNPRLVYGRMTGWGQQGPLAASAGHDINYIAMAGVLAHMPRVDGIPMPPLNLVGDFAGGGMLLAFGMACALFEGARSGRGQVVDAAMVDGAALMMMLFHGLRASGMWNEEPGANSLEGRSPSYGAYETSDGRFIAIGAAEPQFWTELLRRIGLPELLDHDRSDPKNWPAMRERIAKVFRERTFAEWCRDLEGTDTCFSPVLTMEDAPAHPHNAARKTFVQVDGVTQPAPAPRFGRTVLDGPRRQARPGEHSRAALEEWGFDHDEVTALIESGAVVCAPVEEG